MRAKIFHDLSTMCTLCLILALTAPGGAAAQDASYRLSKKLTLGGEGGWDYFDVDPNTGHVFIPRGPHVLVLDSEGQRLADIPNTKDSHAIAFAPSLKRAYLSTEASVTILDTESLKLAGEIPLPKKDPDAILYDDFSQRVFTFNGGGTEDATAIDVKSAKIAGNIPLGGKPETAQADGLGHIYVNIESKNEIVAFDSKSLKILNRWPVSSCNEPAGMAIDTAHQRLFVGCHNQVMAVVDYTNGKVLATVPIGKGTDANRFDAGTGFAFASCGDGTITVAHEDSPGNYKVVQTIATQRGARTMALDPKTHNVYAVTAQTGPPPPPTADNPHPYPTVIAKTFTLLIFKQSH